MDDNVTETYDIKPTWKWRRGAWDAWTEGFFYSVTDGRILRQYSSRRVGNEWWWVLFLHDEWSNTRVIGEPDARGLPHWHGPFSTWEQAAIDCEVHNIREFGSR